MAREQEETLSDRIPPIGRLQRVAEENFRANMARILREPDGLKKAAAAAGKSMGDLWSVTWPPEEIKLDRLSCSLIDKIAASVGKTADDLLTKPRK